MAITKLFCMEHLPQDFYGSANTGYGFVNADLDVKSFWGSGSEASGNVCTVRTKDGKLLFGKRPVAVVSSSCAGKVTIPFSKLIGGPNVKPNKVTMGFRCQRVRAAQGMYPLFAITTERESGQPYAGYHDVVQHNVADPLNTLYYEIELDFVARTVRTWIDNTPTINVAMNAGITKDNIANFFWQMGTIAIYLMNWATDDPAAILSDIYVTTDTGIPGDPYTGRLGPINVVRTPILDDGSSPWPTSNSQTVTAVLNTRRTDAATQSSPYIGNDLAKTPLKLKLDTSGIQAGGTVLGMAVSVTPFRDAAGGIPTNISLKYNADVLSLLDLTPSVTTPGPDTNLGLFTTLPGGVALSKTSIAAAELVFTPT
jgi:hypothetical protein